MPRWIVFSFITVLMYGLFCFLATLTEPAHYNIPFLVSCAVMGLGVLPTLIPPALSREFHGGNNKRRGTLIALAAGVVAGVGNLGPFAALHSGGPPTVVFPITAGYPLLTAVAAVILLRERINLVQIVGIIVGVGGVIILAASASGEGSEPFLQSLQGALQQKWFWWSVLNLVGQSILGLLYKISTNDISPERSQVFFGLTFSACSLVIYLVDVLYFQQLDWHLSWQGWVICLGLGMTVGIGVLSQIIACRHGKAALVTALTSLYPAVTTAMVVRLLGAPLGMMIVVGTAMVLGGAVGITRETEPVAEPS